MIFSKCNEWSISGHILDNAIFVYDTHVYRSCALNSLWPNDAVQWHSSRSTLPRVMPYRNQAVNWTDVDLSLMMFSGDFLRVKTQWLSKVLIYIIGLKNIFKQLLPHLKGDNELTHHVASSYIHNRVVTQFLWITFTFVRCHQRKVGATSVRYKCFHNSEVRDWGKLGEWPPNQALVIIVSERIECYDIFPNKVFSWNILTPKTLFCYCIGEHFVHLMPYNDRILVSIGLGKGRWWKHAISWINV